MTINLTREDFEQAIKSGASVFEGNTILDTGKTSGRYYRFIRVPLANGEHKVDVLNINGKTTEVKYPVKGMMNSDILYGGGFSTCNITPRSEENRIEEFIANNDSQLEDNRRIPIKYIPEVYYRNKLIWKNPNFANT